MTEFLQLKKKKKKKIQCFDEILAENKKDESIANGDEIHRAQYLKPQQSKLNIHCYSKVQNLSYRGRQGSVTSEVTFDLSDIY